MSSYLCVVENKNNKIINKTEIITDFNNAKKILEVLMYQTGVRYGYLLECVKDILGNKAYTNKVYDSVIVHEGE